VNREEWKGGGGEREGREGWSWAKTGAQEDEGKHSATNQHGRERKEE